jgi:hypothetical protein
LLVACSALGLEGSASEEATGPLRAGTLLAAATDLLTRTSELIDEASGQ